MGVGVGGAQKVLHQGGQEVPVAVRVRVAGEDDGIAGAGIAPTAALTRQR